MVSTNGTSRHCFQKQQFLPLTRIQGQLLPSSQFSSVAPKHQWCGVISEPEEQTTLFLLNQYCLGNTFLNWYVFASYGNPVSMSICLAISALSFQRQSPKASHALKLPPL